MNDNILQIERDQPVVETPPAFLAAGAEETPKGVTLNLHYPLDWEKTTVRLGKGRSVTLRRPTQAEVLARDAELQTEIPIGKDGGYALPDPTLNDAIDAKYFDQVKVEVTGYAGEMPEQHKAEAFKGLYAREIYVDEDFELSDETVPVIEEIGSGLEPDYSIVHVMRPPTEAELKIYRRKSSAGEIKPGKRGRQKFVTSSNLRTAMAFYAQWLVVLVGATVEGKTWTDENRSAFIAHVDPLIQKQVVGEVVDAFTAKLSD